MADGFRASYILSCAGLMVVKTLQAKFLRFSQFYKDKVRRKIDEKPYVIFWQACPAHRGPVRSTSQRSERENDEKKRSLKKITFLAIPKGFSRDLTN